MGINKNSLAFPAFDNKGECGNDSTGLSKMEYVTTKILQAIISNPSFAECSQFSEMIDRSISIANDLFKQLEKDERAS